MPYITRYNKKPVPPKPPKTKSGSIRVTDSSKYKDMKENLVIAKSLVKKRNEYICKIHEVFRETSYIVPMFLALRKVDDFITYRIKLEDIPLLLMADRTDIFNRGNLDIKSISRLKNAGLINFIIVKGNKSYFIMPEGKAFINKLNKIILKCVAPAVSKLKNIKC